jgi:subfamily B ATP-binding cassette protein MsbA
MAIADQKLNPARPGFSIDALIEQDHSRWPVFIRLLRECVLPHWPIVAISIATMLVSAATAGVVPFVLKRVGDDLFVAKDATLVFVLPAVLVAAVLIRAVTDWISTVAEASLGTKIRRRLRFRLFDTIAAADLAWIQGSHSGRFVATFINDTTTIDRAATKVMVGFFRNGAGAILLLAAMFYMDWRLSLFVLIGAPLAILNLGKQRTKLRRYSGRGLKQYGELNSMLTQTLQSMRVVKAYGQEANEARRFRRIVHDLRKYLMKATRQRAAVGPIWEVISGLGLAAAILTAAGRESTAT